jgi:hypothetical protein
MAKSISISDNLYALAQMEAQLEHRSIAQQLEHWAKLGMAASRGGGLAAGTSQAKAAVEATRRLDARDVRSGARPAEFLHFVPRSMARESKPRFPASYRKS